MIKKEKIVDFFQPSYTITTLTIIILIIGFIFLIFYKYYDQSLIYTSIKCSKNCNFSFETPLLEDYLINNYNEIIIANERYKVNKIEYAEPYINYQQNIPYQKVTIYFTKDNNILPVENKIDKVILLSNKGPAYKKLLAKIFRKESHESIR